MRASRRVALAVLAASLATSGVRSGAAGASSDPAAMLTQADAVIAGEIVDTDYTATAADGPMYAEAKILGTVKGPFTPGDTLKFGESAWCGPDFERRERRILFLRRVTSRDYYRAASWATICRPGDRLNVFFAPDSVAVLSPLSLRAFLETVRAGRQTPPRVRADVASRERTSVTLLLVLSNDQASPLWVNPALITVSFQARGIRLFRQPKFAGVRPAWIELARGESLHGRIRVASREIKGETRIILQVSHNSVYFPRRSWAGAVMSAPVRLEH